MPAADAAAARARTAEGRAAAGGSGSLRSRGLHAGACEAIERFGLVGAKLPAPDRRARAGRQIEQKPEIMQGEEPQTEQLALVDEVSQVRAREARARRACTAFVERALVAGKAGVPEV